MAINAPIQGSAADIVMRAMVVLHEHERLRELGWKQVLQIHDEIILEGPAVSQDEAMEIVKQGMEHPFGDWEMGVELKVDAHLVDLWGQAK